MIPNRPQIIILTDRADGKLWSLDYNGTRVSITNVPINYKNEGARIYDANNGPVFDEDGQFSLFVRGGRIGIEYKAFNTGEVARDNAPIYARQIGNNYKLMAIDILDITRVHLGMIL